MQIKNGAIGTPYSKKEIAKIRTIFAELRRVSKSRDAKEYVQKTRTGLKA